MKYERFHFERVTSTNDYAKELLQEHNCVVVTAEYQTKGRGRNKNQWFGDFGQNVYLSFGLRHNQNKLIEEVAYFQGLGSLAVLHTLRDLAPNISYFLKYPNDVYAKSRDGSYRKISGILVEHQFLLELCVSSVIGIGINVNQTQFPEEIRESATSLKLLGYEFDVEEVIQKLICHITKLIEMFPDEVFNLWINTLQIIGREVLATNRNLLCEVQGIDPVGRLIASLKETGEVLFISDGDSIRYDFEG
ncbi:MAG: biotin--[acetyl-CoA-carboxylase] ligase [Candidatus Kapaibacteriota bacterium]|jgi:BirA family biotin operon repressor/biotin-[acetyl-CoA-carboxylase] ligase